MFSPTDDDDFFNVSASSSGSNLASYFNTSLALKNENSSLVYTAPKPPKSNTEEIPVSKSRMQTSVICTAFVDTFIVTSDKSQTSHGKCGLAVIGIQTLKTYDMILYKSKQNVIMRVKLIPDFKFSIKDRKEASFCDDQNQQWIVHFENVKELDGFVKNVEDCGAKILHLVPNRNAPEENLTAKESDAASDSSQSKKKASILSRMAKMGLPILPNNIPVNSEVRSNITDSESDEVESVKKPVVKKRHKFVSNNGDVGLKANIQTSTTPEYITVNGQLLPVSSLHSAIPAAYSNPSQLMIPNQLMMHPPQLTAISDPLNIFIAENRTHNCELRMNINQLSSKLDRLLANTNQNNTNSASEDLTDLNNKIAEKDKEIIDKNQLIGHIQKQIEKQKQEILEQNTKIKNLTELLEEQKIITFEQSQHIDNLNTTINHLEMKTQSSHTNDIEMKTLSTLVESLKEEIAHKNIKDGLFSQTLKKAMNHLYQEIMENFDENSNYLGNHVKAVLSQKLKISTLNIIQEFNEPSSIETKNETVVKVPPTVPEF